MPSGACAIPKEELHHFSVQQSTDEAIRMAKRKRYEQKDGGPLFFLPLEGEAHEAYLDVRHQIDGVVSRVTELGGDPEILMLYVTTSSGWKVTESR